MILVPQWTLITALSEVDAILDRNPGARVIQTTHDAVTLEMPDWGPIKMDVELKGAWEKTDLPPQTQWERLLAED